MSPSAAQIEDAREWAKAQRTFTVGGLAQELDENGVDEPGHVAGTLIARWVRQGHAKTAGGSPARRAYRWLHASAE